MAITNLKVSNYRPDGEVYLDWKEISEIAGYRVGVGYYNHGESWTLGISFTTSSNVNRINFQWRAADGGYTGEKTLKYKICSSKSEFLKYVFSDNNPDFDGITPKIKANDWTTTNFSINAYLAPGTYYIAFWRNTTYDGMKLQWLAPNFAITGTEGKTYSITYKANSGQSNSVPSVQTKYEGINLRLSNKIPTKINTSDETNFIITGNANGGSFSGNNTVIGVKKTKYSWNFLNWNTAADGTGTSYNSGVTYSQNKTLKLYAQWEKEAISSTYSNNSTSLLPTPTREEDTIATYTVKYSLNGGTLKSTSVSISKKRKYKFDGWATTANATSANAKETYMEKVTLYAYWISQDIAATLILPTPSKKGYLFLGWSTSQSNTTNLKKTGEKVTITDNITYYAIWQKIAIESDKVVYIFKGAGTVKTIPYIYLNGEYRKAIMYVYSNGQWRKNKKI